MRSINKSIMLVALMVLGSIAYGQGQEEKTLLRTEMLAAKLELNEAQKASLDKQLKAAKADKEAQMAKVKAFREEMKRAAFLARQEQEAQLKEILTDEQWVAYEKMKAEQKQHAKKRRGKRGMKKRQGLKQRRANGDGN